MKKIIAVVLMALCLTGCTANQEDVKPMNEGNPIYYVYEPHSKIIYIHQGYKMTPYYSENGKLCRYVDGKFVEVGE